jgi:uncharacterized protein YjbI with pentapeptide repeats
MRSLATRGRTLILGGIALVGLVLFGYLIGSGFEGLYGTRVQAATAEELAAVNSSTVPAIWSNGIRLNGIRLNGIRLNGIRLNGIRLNGIRLNGIRLNGIRLNGIRLNGIRLNGIRLNGIRLNGIQLPDSSVVDNGLTRVSGLDLSNGVQSDPYIGTIDLRNDASLDGITGPYFYARKNSVLEAWIDQDPAETQLFLRYLVECALPEGVSVRLKYKDSTNLLGTGAGNLGTSLQIGQMSINDQEKVSSCLLARTSATGKHMDIDLVGPYTGLFATHADPKRFNLREAAYYGNLFASPIEAYIWLPDQVQARPCTSEGDCGVLQPVGLIASKLYGASANARAGECFVTGAETPGTLNPQEARFGKDKLVSLRYCTNPITGRTYTNVMTVFVPGSVSASFGPN